MREGDPEELANELLDAPRAVRRHGDRRGRGRRLHGPAAAPERHRRVRGRSRPRSREIDRWLMMLDIPPDKGAGRQTFVYNVENAKAADLAAVLNELFGGGEGGGGGAGRGPPGAAARRRRAVRRRRRGGHRTRRASARGAASAASAAPAVGAEPAVGAADRRRRAAGGARRRRRRRWDRRRRRRRCGRARAAAPAAGWAAAAAGSAAAQGGVGTRRADGLGERDGRRRWRCRGSSGQPRAGVARRLAAGRARARRPGRRARVQGPPPVFRQEVRIVADEVTNSLVILATKRDYQLILDVVSASTSCRARWCSR